MCKTLKYLSSNVCLPFPSVIIIFQNTRISQGHSLFFFSFLMLVLNRRICTTFWAAPPLGPEPGSDISEGKGRLKTIYCMLITVNVFCLTLRASSWFIEVRFLWSQTQTDFVKQYIMALVLCMLSSIYITQSAGDFHQWGGNKCTKFLKCSSLPQSTWWIITTFLSRSTGECSHRPPWRRAGAPDQEDAVWHGQPTIWGIFW